MSPAYGVRVDVWARSCSMPHGLLRGDPGEDAGLPEAQSERSADHWEFVRIADAAFTG